MSRNSYSGVGDVYACPVNASGVKTGDYRFIGNAYPLTVQVQAEQKTQKSRMTANAGQNLDTLNRISNISGSLTLRQWDAENLAWAMSGTATAMTASSSSVTDEAVTAAAAGKYTKMAKRGVSNVVVQDVTDTTTYTAGTDYEIEATLGLIKTLSGGSISEDDVLHVDYDYAAESGYQVAIGSNVLNRVTLYAKLKNEYTDDVFVLDLDSVVLASQNETNFISAPDTEYEEMPFDLTIETLDGQSSPGSVDGVPIA